MREEGKGARALGIESSIQASFAVGILPPLSFAPKRRLKAAGEKERWGDGESFLVWLPR